MLKEITDEQIFDVRLRTRLLKDGTITQEQVAEFLAKIPDASDNMEISEVRLRDEPEPETDPETETEEEPETENPQEY